MIHVCVYIYIYIHDNNDNNNVTCIIYTSLSLSLSSISMHIYIYIHTHIHITYLLAQASPLQGDWPRSPPLSHGLHRGCEFMYVCMYVCMYMYVCIYVCICMYMYVCVCICMYVCRMRIPRLRISEVVCILQRGVQWKRGVVICMVLYASLLCSPTPIHCAPDPLHPPLLNTQSQFT